MKDSIIYIDFNRFLNSVSLALDLAEGAAFRDRGSKLQYHLPIKNFNIYDHNFANHSKRTALASLYIADKLGYDDDKLKNLYIAACAHDIGAVEAFSESHRDGDFIYEHSEFGSNIIKKLPLDRSVSKAIRFHHENWDGSGPNGLSGTNIPEESLIIHIADMFEFIFDDNKPYRVQREDIVNWIRSRKGVLFSPNITDALLEACEPERFWLDMENINTSSFVLTRKYPSLITPISLNVLRNISMVFAAIIDKKSAFTHDHSIGLFNHTTKFSKYYGFNEGETMKMKIAALLHDIGKLSIPNHILDKPGKLTAEEFSIIKSHTYYTKLILGNIEGMEDIAEWAANHHETLTGNGYPEGLDASQLCHKSRIMAVCDIYQALTENRPYREGMHRDKAFGIIDAMVDSGKIDASVVKALKEII